jgi:CBS domain containing-hemolysin-like protein
MLRLAMSPLTGLHRAIERLAYRRSRGRAGMARPASVEVEVMSSEADDESALEAKLPDAIRRMLARLIELTRQDAARLMVPAAQMQMLPESVSGPAAAQAFADSGYSRIPLYGESRDDIVGILYAKDLLARLVEAGDPSAIVPRKLAREALRVPETKNAAELLDELRARSVQMAIVIDEYGGVVGLISLEDLLESFVGPIQDEHDEPPPPDPVVTLGGSSYDVDAALPLDELNERLGLRLPTDEDYSTLGGLVIHSLGHLPQPGEAFRRNGVEYTVLSVQGRAIRRLLVRILPATPDPAAPVGNP